MTRGLAGLDRTGDLDRAREQQQLFRQRGLARVRVGNDGEGPPAADLFGSGRSRRYPATETARASVALLAMEFVSARARPSACDGTACWPLAIHAKHQAAPSGQGAREDGPCPATGRSWPTGAGAARHPVFPLTSGPVKPRPPRMARPFGDSHAEPSVGGSNAVPPWRLERHPRFRGSNAVPTLAAQTPRQPSAACLAGFASWGASKARRRHLPFRPSEGAFSADRHRPVPLTPGTPRMPSRASSFVHSTRHCRRFERVAAARQAAVRSATASTRVYPQIPGKPTGDLGGMRRKPLNSRQFFNMPFAVHGGHLDLAPATCKGAVQAIAAAPVTPKRSTERACQSGAARPS